MKANAPEKIYTDNKGNNPMPKRYLDSDIEYTRTDAFIEKAISWLEEQDEMIGISFQKDFLERFKNYMKGK